MSRARNIKPGFFKNDLLAECSVETRLLFIGLWCEADREGRLEYRPKRIKASCMPYDEVDVEDAIAELAERGFLILYEVGGIAHIQIRNWGKHQNPHHKEVGSVIEAPDGHIDTVCAGYIPLSNTIRNRVYARDGRVCRECGAKHGLSIDHIVPVSKGGNSTDDNLQVLCLGCNVRKGNKILSSSVHESCMDHGQAKRIASCPTDSLIPDSLLLNPDSSEKKADADASAPDAPGKPQKQKSAAVTISTWLTSLGDADAIRAEDPIFAYADKAGIPQDFLALSWLRFVEEHKDKPKRQADWPATYRNAVRGNWYHLWYFDKATGDCLLTAAGVQAQRAHA